MFGAQVGGVDALVDLVGFAERVVRGEAGVDVAGGAGADALCGDIAGAGQRDDVPGDVRQAGPQLVEGGGFGEVQDRASAGAEQRAQLADVDDVLGVVPPGGPHDAAAAAECVELGGGGHPVPAGAPGAGLERPELLVYRVVAGQGGGDGVLPGRRRPEQHQSPSPFPRRVVPVHVTPRPAW